jgi:2-methylisocitrate lyase-like PEP mutase family enzyme
VSARFAELHQAGTFVLVNVHDAGSAVIAQAAGAVALGTTSSGHAYSLGRRDAVGALSRSESIERVRQICAAVEIPVSVDAENGWGTSPDDVADTIRLLADAGAAGASIEDWSGDPSTGFYDRSDAAERVAAAVAAARGLAQPFVICARAEAFLHGTPEPLSEVIARLQLFREAGADCVYAPGPTDLATLARIVTETCAPVNALVGFGSSLTVSDVAGIGIRRVSVGGSLYRAMMAKFRDLVTQLITTCSLASDPLPISDRELDRLFHRQ